MVEFFRVAKQMPLSVDDVEQLQRFGDPPTADFGPDLVVVQVDLEGPSANQLSLHHPGKEEGQHTAVHLIGEKPGPDTRSRCSQIVEGIHSHGDEDDHEDLHQTQAVGDLHLWERRTEGVADYANLWIALLK